MECLVVISWHNFDQDSPEKEESGWKARASKLCWSGQTDELWGGISGIGEIKMVGK